MWIMNFVYIDYAFRFCHTIRIDIKAIFTISLSAFLGPLFLSPSFSTHWRLICNSRRICQTLPMKLENFFRCFFHIWNCCVETASIWDKCMSLNINEPWQPNQTKSSCCHRFCVSVCVYVCCSHWRQRHFALLHVAIVSKGNFPNLLHVWLFVVALDIDMVTGSEREKKLISFHFGQTNKLNLRYSHAEIRMHCSWRSTVFLEVSPMPAWACFNPFLALLQPIFNCFFDPCSREFCVLRYSFGRH